MSGRLLKVIVFTQEDRFFIPENIIKASRVCNIIEVVNNRSKNSFDNKLIDLIRWFGFLQCAKMGLLTLNRIMRKIADDLTGNRAFGGTASVKQAAKKIGAEYKIVKNINDKFYVRHVKELKPDLIISFSAPQVVKRELLNVPKYGIINVHGALLPAYRGLLPSFWYLYNNEKFGGSTVHKMSASIDDGDIIEQGSIDISGCKTMFELLKKTKKLGGELMVKAIIKYSEGKVEFKPNRIEDGSYFTWPTLKQAKIFRKRGKRLV